jgi:hypothetical protein
LQRVGSLQGQGQDFASLIEVRQVLPAFHPHQPTGAPAKGCKRNMGQERLIAYSIASKPQTM